MKEFLDFTKSAVDGVNLRNNEPINDHLLEGILFGMEKCIQCVITDLDKKMDIFIYNIILGPLNSSNLFL